MVFVMMIIIIIIITAIIIIIEINLVKKEDSLIMFS